uniref:Uncharacterized protein n=1 Tax=Arundo donax TaxID=35708 RepID=A0A0A9AW73_ARUDO
MPVRQFCSAKLQTKILLYHSRKLDRYCEGKESMCVYHRFSQNMICVYSAVNMSC